MSLEEVPRFQWDMSLDGVVGRWKGGRKAVRRRDDAIIHGMVIDMNESQVKTLRQVRDVLAGTQALYLLGIPEQRDR